ncbi:type VI secretion system tip protein VgrG [Escherichia coli]|uniref:Type VI secretion system tip protein VgrG n=8 Tax=Escherichia coli TaxID=562 RepID=A0A1S0WK87_ECOLX|nr:type VI secretion system Vgr family protein [Escherichia coli]EAA0978123.1 type VI secretion system tip protein VgrG [Escherichia coli]EEV7029748.1 type VI secretion system tip protein VgrG [Escherichia coli]EEX2507384.1 type VI secretion system tip protein VgrG [Escherichia coli]EEY1390653.1 type VI secretion system tip protein VgrG [Escherichia coli]EEY1440119.1 type VI secretion system tip protein VgrG [Escherichia coli]
MSLTDTLSKTISASLNRYHLIIPSCPSPLDVEHFSGREEMSQTYYYIINFTSTDNDLDAGLLLRKSATFTMGTGGLKEQVSQKVVHGVITDFRRISGSADQAKYQVILEPFIKLLDRQHRSHRFFVNKSVPEVVTEVLQEHGLKGWEFEFRLKKTYPKREQINQYQESDLQFIQRLLAEVGIFYFFTLQPDTQTEVVHFGDSQAALTFDKTLAINSPSGMNDNRADSVWGLNVTHNVAEASVTTKAYNHREAQYLLQSAPADMTHGDGDGINYGEVYHYHFRHLERGDKIDPVPETANFYARLGHERYLAEQVRITGNSTDATLAPAQVLTITDSLPPTLPALLRNPVLLTCVGFSASRKDALQVVLKGVPYSEVICWRPPLLPRPKVTGTMTARVASAKEGDIYAWQDASGMYRVKFDADRDDKNPGQESMPVRLAKPYSGDAYGFHFPLIQGTEVAIAFEEGDLDRPYIAHALHDSRHVDHVTDKNGTRNVIRTPANNKLRMEDKRGEEHIKLSTEYGGKTQLNLGHNVDEERVVRGEGAELRTDDWVAIRGGKGILLSADAQPNADGVMLDMHKAIQQLEHALALAKSLGKAAETAKATSADSDSQSILKSALSGLQKPGILAHSPMGIGVVTPEAVRIASGNQSVGIVSGRNTDITAAQSVTVAASNSVSLFAQSAGMQLFAGQGKVDVQAQGDALNLQALKDVTVTSNRGSVTLSASKELTLVCNGAYIKISGGNIELGCPGNILLKSANVQKMRAANLNLSPQVLPKGFKGGFTITNQDTGEVMPYILYKITTAEGDVYSGTTDKLGNTMPIYTASPSLMKIEFPLSSEQGGAL